MNYSTPFKILVLSAAVALCAPAHAGFFDSFFGSKKEEAPKEEVSTPEPAATESTTVTDTALQVAEGLIPSLTSGLGITTQQAEGGMGSLLSMAKNSLSTDEFSQLGQGIPGMESLLGAAPSLSGKPGGNLGGLLSNAGGLAGSIGGMAQLTQQFEALGLSPDMIVQMANLAIDYLSTGGTGLGDILKKGLDTILS